MEHPPMLFPTPGLQVMSSLIHFLGLTILSHCLSRRIQYESLSWEGLRSMPWPRMAVILMFCDSWLFLISSGVLVFGIGLEYSDRVCTAAIYLCIIFYSTSKFFVYAFLAEKVHIVWSPTVGIRRFESPVYLTCIVSVSLYCIVMTLMLGGRPIHETAPNGACIIGLRPIASIPLLVYDLYINMFLTFMFLYPLIRSKMMSSGIRRLSIRTFIAALVALTTSTINIVVLILMNGRELGWVNLGACGGDIIVNAVAIFWVSSGKGNQQHPSSSGLPPADRGRRQLNQLSTGAIDSIQFPTNPKTTGSDRQEVVAAAPMSPVSVTGPPYSQSHSFPKYFSDEDLEGRVDVYHKPGTSWIGRLFSRGKPKEPQHLQISVTREFASQHSQFELQARPHSVHDDKAPDFPSRTHR
ncbi:hypothetical protein B0H34DRAFT_174524 [Crassisporium funariophilum]|nr:hypothetical protein B0H34DRAFT_174524 [Crassisporium funariophilum]